MPSNEVQEPCAVKVARTVPRGGKCREAPTYPDCMVVMFVLCFWVGEAYPWGNEGHTIICEIALQELAPPVKAKVKRLMRQDPQFKTFAKSCIWPDNPRQRGPEHFVNLPRTTTDVQTDTCPQASTCLFTAIKQDTEVLSDAHSTKKKRLAALKFLGHWVGDIHQPMHVSYEDDRGGNSIRESGPCNGNLHAVWDTCLIEQGLGSDANAIATQLRSDITPEERTQWTTSAPVAWANESYAITTTADVGYCVQNGSCSQIVDHRI